MIILSRFFLKFYQVSEFGVIYCDLYPLARGSTFWNGNNFVMAAWQAETFRTVTTDIVTMCGFKISHLVVTYINAFLLLRRIAITTTKSHLMLIRSKE